MAEYRHGIYVNEKATEMQVLSRQDNGVIFAVGTAPVRSAAMETSLYAPELCQNRAEAIAKFGYSSDTAKYTLCEVMDVVFDLYGVAPVVMVNVFNPLQHRKDHDREQKLVTSDHRVMLEGDVLREGLKIETKTEVDDDEVWTDITESATITGTTDSTTIRLAETYAMGAQVYVSWHEPDATKVTSEDILGGTSDLTGARMGLDLIEEVHARFGLTPELIIAPGFSQKPEVALKMAAKASSINGHFSAMAIADLDTARMGGYSGAASWKNENGYTNAHLTACYPAVTAGDKVQHLSTHLAGEMAKLSAENDNIPSESPSNKNALISGMCNLDGSENYFGLEEANYLNGQGIVTLNRFTNWRFWGNRTSIYPGSSDPKDAFISNRRMFDFIKRMLVLNFHEQLDEPILKRKIDSVVNSANTYLNGLTGRGAILGGRVEFLEEDNPVASIADGKLQFRVYITPPSPARELEFTLQYDADYLTTIF